MCYHHSPTTMLTYHHHHYHLMHPISIHQSRSYRHYSKNRKRQSFIQYYPISMAVWAKPRRIHDCLVSDIPICKSYKTRRCKIIILLLPKQHGDCVNHATTQQSPHNTNNKQYRIYRWDHTIPYPIITN